MTAQTTFKARQRRRIALLALSVALGFAAVHMAATPAAACGASCEGPAPSPEPKGATPEEMQARGRASAATTADLCDRPTSIKPVGYADDAKTWPCRNFSK